MLKFNNKWYLRLRFEGGLEMRPTFIRNVLNGTTFGIG